MDSHCVDIERNIESERYQIIEQKNQSMLEWDTIGIKVITSASRNAASSSSPTKTYVKMFLNRLEGVLS